jgi:hypothetical protein
MCFALKVYFRSDVQAGQRVALIEISVRQYGHVFVVTSASFSSFFSSLFIWWMKRKITSATIRKSMIVLRNKPTFKVADPASCA